MRKYKRQCWRRESERSKFTRLKRGADTGQACRRLVQKKLNTGKHLTSGRSPINSAQLGPKCGWPLRRIFRREATGLERERLRAENRRNTRGAPARRPRPAASSPTPLPSIGVAVPASHTIRLPHSTSEPVILQPRRAANSGWRELDPVSELALIVVTPATPARNVGRARRPRETCPR